MEMILAMSAVLLGEFIIFLFFERRFARKKEESEAKNKSPELSQEGRFWQNIISYDHKKGGEKD